MPLPVNSTPLSDDVAAPPAPVPGAPEGTVAGGVVGGTVGGPDGTPVVGTVGALVVVVGAALVVVVGAAVVGGLVFVGGGGDGAVLGDDSFCEMGEGECAGGSDAGGGVDAADG